jgi:16S rRNA (guanine966-N2)-methyltransferase
VRIVAGQWRGRRIEAPPGRGVRPTLDRVREAWMSIVHIELPGSRVVDLFAGSGALGLEALSRGAAAADFVENDPRALRVLRANIELLGPGDRAEIRRSDALRFAAELPADAYDLAFADPPYAGGGAAKLAGVWLKRPFARILSVEHDSRETLPGGAETRRYGSTAITFYRNED